MSKVPFYYIVLNMIGLVQIKQKNSDESAKTVSRKIKIPYLAILPVAVMILIPIAILLPNNTTPSQVEPVQHFTGKYTSEQIMRMFPTPSALQISINNGEISYDELPADIKTMVKPRQ